jgi:predicted GNAT superfamily acetyltransferase
VWIDHAAAETAWDDRRMARTALASPQVPPEVREHAAAAAQRAAERAGVVVRPLVTLPELEACSELIERIWDDGEPKAPTSLLRALAHAGGFVAGAYGDGELLGISFGFLGLGESSIHLHSHITGVAPGHRSRSVGFALKQFQRSWALAHDVPTIEWTADPLVRGNVYFNLVKLGASIVAYHDDFYGPLRDRLNAGEESDRVLMRWDLASERAIRAAEGAVREPELAEGGIVLREGADGEPAVDGAHEPNGTVLAWIPEDIVRIRAERPGAARDWRHAVRRTVGRFLADGYRAEEITRSGWLVLTR